MQAVFPDRSRELRRLGQALDAAGAFAVWEELARAAVPALSIHDRRWNPPSR